MDIHKRTVYVTGLDEGTSADDLHTMFRGISDVQTCIFVLGHDMQPTDKAYVVLAHEEDIMTASSQFSNSSVTVQRVSQELMTEFHSLLVEYETEQQLKDALGSMTHVARSRILSRLSQSLVQKPVRNESETVNSVAATAADRNPTCCGTTSVQHVLLQEPTLSQFSGNPGCDSSFGRWRYEVRCLLVEKVYPSHAIFSAVRKSLKSPAADVLIRLGGNPNIESIIAKLQSLYGSVMSGDSLLEKFYTEPQKDSEGCAQWSNHLEDLIYQAEEKGVVQRPAMPDMLKNRFWSGLYDSRIKSDLRYRLDNLTFEQVVSEARTLEQEFGAAGCPTSSQVSESTCDPKVEILLKRMDQLGKEIKELERQLSKPKKPQSSKPAKQPQKRKQNSKAGRKETHRVTSSVGRGEVTETSPDCNLLGHANEADVIIGGKQCLGLIDTGSMISSVGEDFYRKHLQDQYELHDLNTLLQVEGAGGHHLTYLGYIEAKVSIPHSKKSSLWVPVLVAPATGYNRRVPLIVGTNILGRLKEEDVKECDAISLAVRSLTSVPKKLDDVNVYSCRQIVVPPNGTVLIKGRLGIQNGIKSGVLEPADTLPGGLMLDNAVVNSDDDNMVHVRLRNLTARSIELPPRQRVASLQHSTILETPGPSKNNPLVRFQHLDSSSEQDLLGVKEIPVHLEESTLTPAEKEEVQKMLLNWKDVFAFSPTELGKAKGVKHKIVLKDNVPFKDRPRRIPPGMYDEVKQHLKDMLACGAIRPSKSPWSSNVVLVRKKDGSLRLCLDFRRLNEKTVRDAYMLPRIEETLDSLQGARWFSSLDLQSGYWQVEVEEQDKPKTAFSVGNLGFYECNRMPFGLTNAPATFQRLMEKALADLPNCFAYLDDIIIYSSGSFSDHLLKLERVFERLLDFNLKLKPSKCHLFLQRIKYLGHVISTEGVETDPDKTEAIRNWPQPTTVHELRQALGFFGYYRRFVKHYAQVAKPLHDLLKGHENNKRSNKTTSIKLDQEAVDSFNKLKELLTSPPILAYADYKLPFEVHTDASSSGLGAILYQHQDGQSRVIAYASRNLKPSEANYPAHKLEFLALKWAVCDKFHRLLVWPLF